MKNVGILDRIVRVFLMIVFFVVGSLYVDGLIREFFYVLALVMIVTATIGKCPLYNIFKISTKKDFE